MINKNGELLSYAEFLQKFRIPVTPEEYAVIFNAIPSGSVQLFKNCNFAKDNIIRDNHIFIGETDILNKLCSKQHIRNASNSSFSKVLFPPSWAIYSGKRYVLVLIILYQ